MKYNIEAFEYFKKQLISFDFKTKQIIKRKISLLETNPYHFKRIKGFQLDLFRIRVKDKRVIYVVDNFTVKILFILDRKYDYKDLPKYLRKLGYL